MDIRLGYACSLVIVQRRSRVKEQLCIPGISAAYGVKNQICLMRNRRISYCLPRRPCGYAFQPVTGPAQQLAHHCGV